jgi:3-deoxy-manno-octulosonate cytidylyltransferase (CMP-KDO synthetase)
MIDWKQWLVVVPARLQSTRLPQKPLADLAGRPLVVRVYDRLRPWVELGAEVVVATDDASVMEACQRFEVPSLMTRKDHQSGTDRCAEIAAQKSQTFVLNVQGDEPFLEREDLERLLLKMTQDQGQMGTLVHKNTSSQDFTSPHCVKAVFDETGRALYFSRSPIPYPRPPQQFSFFWQHVGVYAFARETLLRFCHFPQHPLEISESLEQLRALGYGIPILISEAKHPSIGIDTPEDLEAARARFR